ncbi:ABC transporter permease [Mycobacterium marinum]|uniref:ABC transporter permease n=1 Tax=Mycobacterium marinum TaxID=1781 RepID=UPI00356369CF
MTVSASRSSRHRLRRTAKSLVREWNRLGSQMRFYVTTLTGIPDAVMHYRSELLRVIAQMGFGAGTLAVIGGTVVIVGFLAMTTGAIVAVQGYNQFASVGVEALTGFASAFFNTREIQPGTVMVALAATVGAGATAQLGAMRINEEIDALEVIGIRSVSYLASTRVVAGVVVAIPLFCVGLITAYLAARAGTTAIYGQGSGVYDHYFNTFLRPTDVLWSSFEVVVVALMIMLVCTYYGYNARGGAVRASMVVASIAIVIMTLAIYGQSPNFHLAS